MSFVVVMVKASDFHLQRLPLFCSNIGEILFSMMEALWYKKVFAYEVEREIWASNSDRTVNAASRTAYDILRERSTMLMGRRRVSAMLLVAIPLLVLGHLQPESRWALWPGALLSIEAIGRIVCHACWLWFPRWGLTRNWLLNAQETMWPRVRALLMRSRELDVVQNHERVPYEEPPELDVKHFINSLWCFIFTILSSLWKHLIPKVAQKER